MSKRVLHVLDHYRPVVDGYSIRSTGIILSQRKLGFEPVAVTSMLHPREIDIADGVEGGVQVFRSGAGATEWQKTLVRRRLPFLRESIVVSRLQSKIESLLSHRKFDVIHAHSPALCGLAAARAAKNFGIPLVYEIRAFWEDAAVDQGRGTTGSPRYRAVRALETNVAHRAKAVVGIASYMVEDLANRGIDQKKLFHVPNGVDCERFRRHSPNLDLQKKLNPDGRTVFGFIGSFYHFEGVAWMVKAFAQLHKYNSGFQVLLVGDGEDMKAVRANIRNAECEEYITVVGRVPHEAIDEYYSIMDIMVYPRISIRLTELVTALKPLEALAQEKTVLASSVAAMKELISNGVTGLLFEPENVDDFCCKARSLMMDHSLREKLGKAGRKAMLTEKDWEVIGMKYMQVYDFCEKSLER